jgi:hypothetical protein
MTSPDGNYYRTVAWVVRNVEKESTSSDPDWASIKKSEVAYLIRISGKSIAEVSGDLDAARRQFLENEAEEEDLKYCQLDEYGEDKPIR